MKRQLGILRDWIEYRVALLFGVDLKERDRRILAEIEEIDRNREYYAEILRDPNNNPTI